jgi:putative lipoprotein
MKVLYGGKWMTAALILLLGALSVSAQGDNFGVVDGVVTFQAETLLEGEGRLVVELLDIAPGDVPAQSIASQTILTAGRQAPFAFALYFDPPTINETHSYNVSAKLYVGDEVKWYTAAAVPVIMNGNHTAEVKLLPIELSSFMEPPPTYELITGTVAYLQRMALPDDAVVEVQLLDVSRADAPAFVLASQQFVTNERQVPLNFALAYDPNGLREHGSYSVSARITVGGRLSWITDTNNPVITNGISDLDLTLVAVDS